MTCIFSIWHPWHPWHSFMTCPRRQAAHSAQPEGSTSSVGSMDVIHHHPQKIEILEIGSSPKRNCFLHLSGCYDNTFFGNLQRQEWGGKRWDLPKWRHLLKFFLTSSYARCPRTWQHIVVQQCGRQWDLANFLMSFWSYVWVSNGPKCSNEFDGIEFVFQHVSPGFISVMVHLMNCPVLTTLAMWSKALQLGRTASGTQQICQPMEPKRRWKLTFKSSRPAFLCDSWIIWMCISPREFLEGLSHTLTNGFQDEKVWTFRIRSQWACISMHFCPCEGAPLCSGYNHHGTLPILGAAMWCPELYMDSCLAWYWSTSQSACHTFHKHRGECFSLHWRGWKFWLKLCIVCIYIFYDYICT